MKTLIPRPMAISLFALLLSAAVLTTFVANISAAIEISNTDTEQLVNRIYATEALVPQAVSAWTAGERSWITRPDAVNAIFAYFLNVVRLNW